MDLRAAHRARARFVSRFPVIIIVMCVAFVCVMHERDVHADDVPKTNAEPTLAGDAVTLPALEVTAPDQSPTVATSFHQQIRARDTGLAAPTAADFLHQATGVTIRELGSSGARTTVSIRGSSAEQVGVYLDGLRLNSAGLGAADLSVLPTEAIESFEVVRGGGSTLFGPDAIGGVVLAHTRRAELGTHVSARASLGAWWTARANASVAHRSESRGFLAAFAHESSNGNFSFTPAPVSLNGTVIGERAARAREHNRFVSESVLLKGDVSPELNVELSGLNFFRFSDQQFPGTESEAILLAPANPLEAQGRRLHNSTSGQIAFRDIAARGIDVSLGGNNVFEWQTFSDPSPALGSAIARRTWVNELSPFVQASWRVGDENSATENHLSARYEVNFSHLNDDARNATTTASGVHQRVTYQGMLADRAQFFHERLEIAPALRASGGPQHGAHLTYRLGVRGNVSSFLSLLASAETSFREPTLLELFYPDQGFIRGNPDLAAERAWHYDLGANGVWTWGSAQANFFEQHTANSILFVPVSATTIAPINTFAVRTRGVESVLTLDPWTWLHVNAQYTWLSAHFTSTDKQLPGRPVHEANLLAQVRMPLRSSLYVIASVAPRFQSELPLNVDNTVFVGSRFILDSALQIEWTHRDATYTAGIDVKNLTNAQTYDARGFPLPRWSWIVTVGAKFS